MQHDPSQPPGLLVSNPTVQNQIHEYTKSLPPPRKQNTACDACRTRKVKCNRFPGQDKCQHCLSKNYPCTHYVQQATSEKKRNASITRRPRSTSSAGQPKYAVTLLDSAGQPSAVLGRFASPPSLRCRPLLSSYPGPLLLLTAKDPSSSTPTPAATASSYLENGHGASIPFNPHNLPLGVRFGFYPPITLSTPTRDVLTYVFAPPDNSNDPIPFHLPPGRARSPYDCWGEEASQLENDSFKAEFSLDLVEVFFQIVHTRIPLLNPAQFRSRFQQSLSQPSGKNPLHPALVAAVLAWGAKFSEHPLLVADRRRPGGLRLLAKELIDRARNLAEALKVHRIPTPDHVVIGLLIEPLQSQNAADPTGFHGFWLTAATHHLLDLQINHKSTMSQIPDVEARGTMIFAWWMACICDAYASAYYRRKPVLDDDDYDIDFYTLDPISEAHGPMTSPREQLEFIGYYKAAHSLARISRHMSRQLWIPATDSDGIPIDALSSFTSALLDWRDNYLKKVGVPNNFRGDWDFVSAVSSCASDATYHVMWIILFNATDDFGVKEIKNHAVGSKKDHIEEIQQQIMDEALQGALRIAGLAAVLTEHGYLKLDPAVMHVSCIKAGTLLARLGRPEARNCINGLEQYSYSYEEAGDQAAEMKKTYSLAQEVGPEFSHMAQFISGTTPDHAAMVVDEQDTKPDPSNSQNYMNSHASYHS